MQGSRILLTGAKGFLGKTLALHFLKEKNEVVSLGTSTSNDIRCDLANNLPVLCGNYDVVIHSAGKAHSVPKSAKEEEEFYNVNCQGTINLCHALDSLEIKPQAFIFISTVAVYGLDKGIDIDESNALMGSTPYAKSKILAEEYLVTWAKENNITLGILRLPIIAGPNPPGNLGAMISGIQSGKYFSIGKASAKKSIVWADDIANIIPKLAEFGGIYNLTDGYDPSFGELEKEISKCLGKKLPIKIPLWVARVLAKAGDLVGSNAPVDTKKLNKIISSLTFNDQKARRDLGWSPTIVLETLSKIV